MKKFLGPIAPKIDKKFIEENKRNPEVHYGKNKKFRFTFNILDAVQVIYDPAPLRTAIEKHNNHIEKAKDRIQMKCHAKDFVAFHLYAYAANPLNFLESKNAQHRSALERIRKLCCGEASFLYQEARYFYNGFGLGFGQEWKDSVQIEDFILGNIYNIIQDRLRDGLHLPWSKMDAVGCFRIACQLNSNEIDGIDFELITHANDKFSIQSGIEQRDLKPTIWENTLQSGAEFRLQISGLASEEEFFVIEYSRDPLIDQETGNLFQAQLMQFYRRKDDGRILVEGHEKPLVANGPNGEYGYLLFSGYKARKLLEQISVDSDHLISEGEFSTLAEQYRVQSFVPDSDLNVSMIEYRLEN